MLEGMQRGTSISPMKLADGFSLSACGSSDEEYSDCDFIDDSESDEFPFVLTDLQNYREISSRGDPQNASVYIDDIIQVLQAEEEDYTIPPGAIVATCGSRIRDLRFRLGDWLFNLSFAYPSTTEVLFQTFSLLDRYLARKPVENEQLQLVASCCMWITVKVELDTVASLDPLIQCCHSKYTRQDFIEIERDILATVDYRIQTMTSNFFLRRFLKVINAGDEVAFLASYFGEVTLMYTDFSSIKPSLIAFTSVVLAWILEKKGNLKNLKLQSKSFSYEEVSNCAKLLMNAVKSISKQKQGTVFRKYESKKINNVEGGGTTIINRMQSGSGLFLSIASLFGKV